MKRSRVPCHAARQTARIGFDPRFETIERRLLLTTFLVTSTDASGNPGKNLGQGTYGILL